MFASTTADDCERLQLERVLPRCRGSHSGGVLRAICDKPANAPACRIHQPPCPGKHQDLGDRRFGVATPEILMLPPAIGELPALVARVWIGVGKGLWLARPCNARTHKFANQRAATPSAETCYHPVAFDRDFSRLA